MAHKKHHRKTRSKKQDPLKRRSRKSLRKSKELLKAVITEVRPMSVAEKRSIRRMAMKTYGFTRHMANHMVQRAVADRLKKSIVVQVAR